MGRLRNVSSGTVNGGEGNKEGGVHRRRMLIRGLGFTQYNLLRSSIEHRLTDVTGVMPVHYISGTACMACGHITNGCNKGFAVLQG